MANLFKCGGGNPNLRHNKSTGWIQCKDTNGNWVDLYKSDICPIEPLGAVVGTSWDYAYAGAIATFTAPCNGVYMLEVWGSRGGNGNAAGGAGGYSKGYVFLNTMEVLYVVCGGIGNSSMENTAVPGGYNGGGNGNGYPFWPNYTTAGGGGGATHIARTTGLLTAHASTYTTTLLIVAGGGGGGYSGSGGAGGGLSGSGPYPGTQTSGIFGQGTKKNESYGAGGGGGFRGGDAQSGGSGYIDGVKAFNSPAGTYYEPSTKAGVNSEAGKAKITLVAYS